MLLLLTETAGQDPAGTRHDPVEEELEVSTLRVRATTLLHDPTSGKQGHHTALVTWLQVIVTIM